MSGRVAPRFAGVLGFLLVAVMLPSPMALGATHEPGSPILTSITLESGATAGPGDTIVYRWTAQDETEVSGRFALRSEYSASWIEIIFTEDSVQLPDGSWTGTVSVPVRSDNLPPGKLTVASAALTDGPTRSSYSFPQDMPAPTVDVVGTEFQLGPRLLDVGFTQSTAEPGDTLTVRFRAEDMQGIKTFSGQIRGPHFHHPVSARDPQARSLGNNVWEWEYTFETDSERLEPGKYWVSSVHLVDLGAPGYSAAKSESYDEGTAPMVLQVSDSPGYETDSPTIDGRTQVPHVLTAHPGVWGPGPVSLSYQWIWNVTPGYYNYYVRPIVDATNPGYQLGYPFSNRDLLQVEVTGTWPDGTQRTRRSQPITKVLAGDHDDPVPHTLSLIGPGEVDTRITAKIDGTWPADTYFTYSIYADGVKISGSDGADLSTSHLGKTLEARVQVSTLGYTPKTYVSEPRVVLRPRPKQKDMNADFNPDVIARDSAGALWFYAGAGNNSFDSRVQIGTGWNSMNSILMPGDFDGDRSADLMARDASGALWLYPGNSSGHLQKRRQIGSGWQGMTALVAPGDFNGDLNPDLLARDSLGRLFHYPGNGTGGFLKRVQVGSGWNSMTRIFGAGDFNGDKASDVYATDALGQLWLYPGNGKGGFLSRIRVGTGWAGMSMLSVPGSLDAYDTPDLLARDKTGRLWVYSVEAGRLWPPYPVGNGWQIYNLLVP